MDCTCRRSSPAARSVRRYVAWPIQIQQIKSPIRRHHRQRETLIGLGLNRIDRVALVPATPATRGMIAKVQHLDRVLVEPLSLRRFDGLAGYARAPLTRVLFDDIEWFATPTALCASFFTLAISLGVIEIQPLVL